MIQRRSPYAIVIGIVVFVFCLQCFALFKSTAPKLLSYGTETKNSPPTEKVTVHEVISNTYEADGCTRLETLKTCSILNGLLVNSTALSEVERLEKSVASAMKKPRFYSMFIYNYSSIII